MKYASVAAGTERIRGGTRDFPVRIVLAKQHHSIHARSRRSRSWACAAHEAFLKKYVGKDDGAFRASWRSLVFTGQGSMPKAFDTDVELLNYISATSGAIGYVGKDPGHDNVKSMAVK
jgi:hypothetical protein